MSQKRQGSSVECWVHCDKDPLLNQRYPWSTTNILQRFSYLLFWLKSWSARGGSHHAAFMGNCWTISHKFYSSIPVDEGNEDVGLVWDNIFLLFRLVWINFIASAENPGREGSTSCVLYQLKSRSSGGDWNVSRMTLHEFDITFIVL